MKSGSAIYCRPVDTIAETPVNRLRLEAAQSGRSETSNGDADGTEEKGDRAPQRKRGAARRSSKEGQGEKEGKEESEEKGRKKKDGKKEVAVLDSYRTLVALRYAAEQIDEVNVFLARAVEINLRLQMESAFGRAAGYLAGAIAALVGAYSIDPQWAAPARVLAVFLGLMTLKAVIEFFRIKSQREELAVDHRSVREYLRKATRDRKENGAAVAIQNRIAAHRLQKTARGLDEEERQFLMDSVEFWGQRIKFMQSELAAQENSEIWQEDAERFRRINGWIEAELSTRPVR